MSATGKGRILVVEQDERAVALLDRGLTEAGYRTAAVKTAESALARFRRSKPDACLINTALPDQDGLDLCAQLRQQSPLPILLLSAKQDELDRVLAFKMGADDYLPVPVSVPELLVRMEARMRRRDAQAYEESSAPLMLGQVELDLESHEIRERGRARPLAPKEFGLLKVLLEANGKVVSRPRLQELVWGHDESMELDTRTVDQHVARLRQKLGSQRGALVTVKKFGYQLRRWANGARRPAGAPAINGDARQAARAYAHRN